MSREPYDPLTAIAESLSGIEISLERIAKAMCERSVTTTVSVDGHASAALADAVSAALRQSALRESTRRSR